MKESNERGESRSGEKTAKKRRQEHRSCAEENGERRERNRESLKNPAHGQRDGKEKEFWSRTKKRKVKMTQLEDVSFEDLMEELRTRPQGLRRAAMVAGEAGYTAGQPARAGTATKTPCPNLDEFESYAMWRRSYRFWSAATTLDNKGKAAEIMSVLGNKMKNHPQGLLDMCMNGLSDEQLAEPDADVVLQFLDNALGSDEHEDLWKCYKTFEECTIRQGEKYADFLARFQAAWDGLKNKDNAFDMNGKILSMKLRVAARLDPQALMAVRSSVRLDERNVFRETVKMISELHSGLVYKGPAQVKITSAKGEVEISMDKEGVLYANGDPLMEQAIHQQILAAQGRSDSKKKLRDGVKSQGQKEGEATGEERKKYDAERDKERFKDRTCYNCGKKGHISPICPDRQPKKREEGAGYITEAQSLENPWEPMTGAHMLLMHAERIADGQEH